MESLSCNPTPGALAGLGSCWIFPEYSGNSPEVESPFSKHERSWEVNGFSWTFIFQRINADLGLLTTTTTDLFPCLMKSSTENNEEVQKCLHDI